MTGLAVVAGVLIGLICWRAGDCHFRWTPASKAQRQQDEEN